MTEINKTIIKTNEIKPELNKVLYNSLYFLLYTRNNKQPEINIKDK